MELQNDDLDLVQDIARVGYADMLHDQERNDLYNLAIQSTVKHVANSSKNINVIDIGTGTGLLSMMAVRSAQTNNANIRCEAYECIKPMSVCAKDVIDANQYSENIEVFDIRSDQRNIDDAPKADILITELFDTELIGEGAIIAYRHALKYLTKSNVLAVPAKARVWVQLVASEYLYHSNQLSPVPLNSTTACDIKVPDSVLSCPGSGQLHDIQLSQLTPGVEFQIISKAQIAFEFDFSDIGTLKLKDSKRIQFQMLQDISQERIAVLFWWDLYMDWESKILLSCAPYWEHPSGLRRNDLPWREHWIQAVYHPSANKNLLTKKKDEMVEFSASHDEYTFTFDFESDSQIFCTCGLHNHLSRNRIGMLNKKTWMPYINAVSSALRTDTSTAIVYLGDQSLLPLILSSYFGHRVSIFCHAKSIASKDFYSTFCAENQAQVTMYETCDELPDGLQIDVIIGEPYFNSIDLPWDMLRFWYLASKIPNNMLTPATVTIPDQLSVKAIPVQFDHLWKIRAPVGSAQGFNLKPFDCLIQSAIHNDPEIESQPLWEYPGKPLCSKENIVFNWTFEEFSNLIKESAVLTDHISFKIEKNGTKTLLQCFSLVLWSECLFKGSVLLNTGPVDKFDENNYCKWNRDWKQGVFFEFQSKLIENDVLCVETNYNTKNAKLSLKIK